MKDLERQFFKFCCKNINYKSLSIRNIQLRNNMSFNDIINSYISLHPGTSSKQLYHYLNKWDFYSDNCFNFSHLSFDYYKIIPERIIFKCKVIALDGNQDYIKLSVKLKKIKRKEM